MSYSTDITKTLTGQITKFATLNRHQLDGHVANLDFWVGEVRHCLNVIDGYNHRFEQMKAAQSQHTSEHGTLDFRLEDPRHTQKPASRPTRVPGPELGEARRQLCDATYQFLVRCFHDGLIDEVLLRRTCESLEVGVETRDLRKRTGSPPVTAGVSPALEWMS